MPGDAVLVQDGVRYSGGISRYGTVHFKVIGVRTTSLLMLCTGVHVSEIYSRFTSATLRHLLLFLTSSHTCDLEVLTSSKACVLLQSSDYWLSRTFLFGWEHEEILLRGTKKLNRTNLKYSSK